MSPRTSLVPVGERYTPEMLTPPAASHLDRAALAHARALRSALRHIQVQTTNRDRKDALRDLAALLETNASSLASRLIDLARPGQRAALREQLL